jgi:hypothetical protein
MCAGIERGRNICVIGPKRGPYKIGVANEVDKRRRPLNIGNPAQLYVQFKHDTGSEKKGKYIELRLHYHFHAKHVRGEWFDLTSADLQGLSTVITPSGFAS